MGLFNIGNKDRDGRQKRIEHRGRYLRASRTGLVALRAHVKAAGVNVTGNTRRGVRVSTRLAKNTQVAMQNGRFVLRGRYGSDTARFNLSKTGVTVSSRVGLGSVNWLRPGRSSAKFAGVQLRGHKAAVINLVALAATSVVWALGLLGRGLAGILQFFVGHWQRARQAREGIQLSIDDVAPVGERVLAEYDVSPEREPVRDLFAALVYLVAVMGRGDHRLDEARVLADAPNQPLAATLVEDMQVAGRSLTRWLGEPSDEQSPAVLLGVLHHLARGLADRVDEATRAELVFALDDACLALGPRSILQDAMLDVLVESLGVELTLTGEG